MGTPSPTPAQTSAPTASLIPTPSPTPATQGSCHNTEEGERCYAGVTWAMEHGIRDHPDWPEYAGLDADSSFVDFQLALHLHKVDRCPEPCGACHTAVEGERCYEGVMWAMEYGITIHPEWYPELAANSTFEDFQAHLHGGGFNECPEPCRN